MKEIPIMKPAFILLTLGAWLLAACSAARATSVPVFEPSATPEAPPTATSIPFETVTFTTEDDVRLSGTLRGNGQIAVILAHQGTPRADQTTWASFARLLAEHGFAALAFDFRGVGRSGGTFLSADLWKDVQAATQFLRERGYSGIVCAGASQGGTACLVAARHEEYMGLIILASGMTAGSGKHALRLAEEDLASLAPPKLFITAEDDFYVINDMKRMAELAPAPKELILLPGTQHGTDLFSTDAAAKLATSMLDFLDRLQDGTLTPILPTQDVGEPMPPLQVITTSNAGNIQLLKTLEISGFKKSSLSQCSVAFSPDESSLSGVCNQNTIPVWDAQSAELIRSLESSPVHEVALAFSPDGERIATGGFAKEIRVWDAVSGELINTIGPLPSPIWDLAFSPDGQRLASANFDIAGSGFPDALGIHLWDVDSGELLWDYTESDTPLRLLSVDFSPDGKTIAYGTFDSVLILDAETGTLMQSWPIPNHVGDLAFSPDGDLLATGSDDNQIRLWDASDYELQSTLEGHAHYVNGVAFTPDGILLVSGGHDQQIGVWDVESGRLLKMLEGHDAPVLRVAVNPLGTLIASISWDGTVRLWGVTE